MRDQDSRSQGQRTSERLPKRRGPRTTKHYGKNAGKGGDDGDKEKSNFANSVRMMQSKNLEMMNRFTT